MGKRAFIIHGWGADSSSDWIPWLKEELERNGIAAITPNMPGTGTPTIGEWVGMLSTLITNPDPETYLVGHSIGCQAIIRYLSALPEEVMVGGIALIAPWTKVNLSNDTEIVIAKPWIETPIMWDAARHRSRKFVVVYSDNDKFVSQEDAISFGERLGAECILDQNRGHFSDEDDVTQLPILLEKLLAMANS